MPSQMRFASAITIEPDGDEAIRDLVSQVKAGMEHHPVNSILVFLSPHFAAAAAQVTKTLLTTFNPGLLLGCTGEGVISNEREAEQRPAISLVAAHLPDVQLGPFLLQPGDWQTVLSDLTVLDQAIAARSDPKLFIILADPLSTPIDTLLATLNTRYEGVPIVGGMASAARLSQDNMLLLNDRVLTQGVVGVTLSGGFQVDVIVSQGCRPVGYPLTVTAAERNVISSIEGQPPFVHIQDLIEQLSDHDRGLLQANGLFIGRAIGTHSGEPGRGDFLVRGVIGLDQDSGTMTIGDTVRVGETVQFHLRDAKTAEDDLEMMLLSQAFFEPPRGGLLFSCKGRGTRLYNRPNGDISTIRGALDDIQLAGFFCAGEIGPIGGTNFLHGHTASLALFRPSTI